MILLIMEVNHENWFINKEEKITARLQIKIKNNSRVKELLIYWPEFLLHSYIVLFQSFVFHSIFCKSLQVHLYIYLTSLFLLKFHHSMQWLAVVRCIVIDSKNLEFLAYKFILSIWTHFCTLRFPMNWFSRVLQYY